MDERALRAIIFYEFRQDKSTRQATRNINKILGKGTVSHSTVSRWFRRFASGDVSLDDLQRSGRPTELQDSALLQEVNEHPDSTTRELGAALGFSHTAIEKRLHNLGYRRVLARWIPHPLTSSIRATRVSICQSLLSYPEHKDFLASLVTGDESYILYKNDTRTAFWLPREEEPPTKPKPNPYTRKVLLCCWWDQHGMLYYEFLVEGTVTAEKYSEQLRKLAASIKQKRRRMVKVNLLHDNARPHVASATKKTIEELGWSTVPHPPYSPDLAPSDYHLFLALKNFLRGKTFSNFLDIKNTVQYFFEHQDPEFWRRGIENLPTRWAQVIESSGEYIAN